MMSLYSLLYIYFSIVLESFPISSSGHVQLLQFFFNKALTDYSNQIDFFLHGPIACMVALFFFNDWFFLLQGLPKTFPYLRKIFFYGFITDSLTVFAYFFIFKDTQIIPVWAGFLITSMLLCSLQYCPSPSPNAAWDCRNAVILGIIQSIALLPGISRLGSTFVCARWMRFNATRAFQLSFLIEWPISCAAFLKGLFTLYKGNKIVELLQLKMILVMILAMVCGFGCLKLVQGLLHKQTVWLFSLYLLLAAVGSFFLV